MDENDNRLIDRNEQRPRKVSGTQFISLMLLTILVSLLAGFFGSLSLFAASSNDKICEDFIILKDVICKTDARDNISKLVQTARQPVIEESALIDAVKKVKPSVVSIIISEKALDPTTLDEGAVQRSGTGFFVTNDGLIVTNKHVVAGLDQNLSSDIKVMLDDGTLYKATIKDMDDINDLAFIQISDASGKTFTAVEFSDSETLQVGQKVAAIGNALGERDNTVTYGVVSTLGKTIQAGDDQGNSERLEGLIQTDAAINPGNSGGPLINLDGKVVGMNTAGNTTAQLINYSIPSNQIEPVMQSLIENGKIIRSYLGVDARTVTKLIKSQNNLSETKGALVLSTTKDANAASNKLGLKPNDIILSIDNNEILPSRNLTVVLYLVQPGKEVEVIYLRDGKQLSGKVKLTTPPTVNT